jgi:CheY-like chemotaxis protein
MVAALPTHKRLLLIDDNFITRETLSMSLAAEGYMMVAACNGQEAIDRLQSCEPVDLILLDLSMPVMDGQHFREAQRARKELADIPVIVFSGSDQAEETAASLGAVAWLHKPVATADLLDVVRRCCDTAKLASS